MSSEALQEEFEVLESIYPTELSKLSERDLRIDVEPEEAIDGHDELKLSLTVHYPDEYPDILPELSLEAVEGSLENDDLENLLAELRSVGEENMGMAMTFTLVSHLREQLLVLVQERQERRRFEESEKERLALEAEEAKTRGTPVTLESFLAWKAKFDRELALKKAHEEEDKIRGYSAKEKEEIRKMSTRPSGRQLFEHDKTLATDDINLVEEGTVSVDVSQYDRNADHDEDEEEHLTFSDSD